MEMLLGRVTEVPLNPLFPSRCPRAWLLLRAPAHGFLFCDHLRLLRGQASATELPRAEPTHGSRCSFPTWHSLNKSRLEEADWRGLAAQEPLCLGRPRPWLGECLGLRAALEEPHFSYGELDNTSPVTGLIAHGGIWGKSSGP